MQYLEECNKISLYALDLSSTSSLDSGSWVGSLIFPSIHLKLDEYFKENYVLCDNLGLKKSTGPGPARNCAWQHSIDNNFLWHWVMDDNIRDFHRYNNNRLIKVSDGTIFKCMEDFVNRYENIVMAGPNYFLFIARKQKYPPITTNQEKRRKHTCLRKF